MLKQAHLIINQTQSRRLKKIGRKFKLKLILVFGSEIKGETHPLSDLDIAVLRQKSLNWNEHSELVFDLEKVFSGKEIDLVSIDRADPLLLDKISQSSLCLYGTRRSLAEFLIFAFKRYQDYQPFFRLEEKCVSDFVKEGQLNVS